MQMTSSTRSQFSGTVLIRWVTSTVNLLTLFLNVIWCLLCYILFFYLQTVSSKVVKVHWILMYNRFYMWWLICWCTGTMYQMVLQLAGVRKPMLTLCLLHMTISVMYLAQGLLGFDECMWIKCNLFLFPSGRSPQHNDIYVLVNLDFLSFTQG